MFVDHYSKKMWMVGDNRLFDIFKWSAKDKPIESGTREAYKGSFLGYPAPADAYNGYFDRMVEGTTVILGRPAKVSTAPDDIARVYVNNADCTGGIVFSADVIVSTIPIDELVGKEGSLPYAGRDFHLAVLPCKQVFPGDVRFCHYASPDDEWTRITEFKKITYHESDSTLLVMEKPSKANKLYPYLTKANMAKVDEYLKMLPPNVHSIGRLGKYRYSTIEQTITEAFACAAKILGKPSPEGCEGEWRGIGDTSMMAKDPQGGRLVFMHQGVWLPDGEKHFPDWMTKNGEIVDGKGTYQVRKLRATLGLCKQFRTAVDVGGHVGLWAMQLVKRFQYVNIFEPVAAFRDCLAKNVPDLRQPISKYESAARNYSLYPCALGASRGRVRMAVDRADTGGTHVSSAADGDVDLRTLDEFDFADVDCIKIDVRRLRAPRHRGRARHDCALASDHHRRAEAAQARPELRHQGHAGGRSPEKHGLPGARRNLRGLHPHGMTDLAARVRAARRVYVIGNGGSYANAAHIVNDLLMCGVKAYTLDAASLTASANDYGYEGVFERWLGVVGEAGDLLIALSGSGRSPNILRAIEKARAIGMDVHLETDYLRELDMQASEEAQVALGHAIMRELR
jgi:FkbM family methyltransferase